MFGEHWVESSRLNLLQFPKVNWIPSVKSSKCFQCSMQFCQLCGALTLKRTKKNQKNINANNAQLTNPRRFGNAKKNLLGTYWGAFFDHQALPRSKLVKRAEKPKPTQALGLCFAIMGHEFGIFLPFQIVSISHATSVLIGYPRNFPVNPHQYDHFCEIS